MARKCHVTTCSNTYKKTKNLCVIDEKSCTITAITYHTFPRQPYLRQKWINATGRLNWEPTNASFICSEHFRESDYETLNQKTSETDEGPTQLKRVLKRNAVPTQQLGRLSTLGQFPTNTNENNVGASSDTNESSELSSNGNIIISGGTIDLSIVKDEPYSPDKLESEPQEPHFIITSAITVKEENDYSDKQNGILDSETDYSSRNHLESRYEYSPDHIRAKRLKHQDSLIAPEDIKVEKGSPPFNFNFDPTLSIEEKYERLLDEFLKLKRDYDLLKFKCDRQSDAINKCEHILSGCR